MENLQELEKLILKLFVLLYFDILAIQPDFFVWSIATALYSFILGFFL